MEKNHSMFRIVTHCLGAFRRPFCSSIGTQLGGGGKHPPLRHHRDLRLVLRLLKELPFVCGDVCVCGGGGRFLFLFFILFSLVVMRERDR